MSDSSTEVTMSIVFPPFSQNVINTHTCEHTQLKQNTTFMQKSAGSDEIKREMVGAKAKQSSAY